MLCSFCKKKPATVHLTQIVEGKTQKVDLCEDCAKEKGLDQPTGFMLADMLLGLGAAEQLGQAAAPELTCPQCGFTQSDFKKLGRFGCPNCYQVFADGLEELLKTMHRGIRHTGKIPRQHRDSPLPPEDTAERIKQLSRRLEQAIDQEDYELAAHLRDEIKKLKARSPAKNG